MVKKLVLFYLISFLCVCVAVAQPKIKLDVIYISSPYGVGLEEARNLVNRSILTIKNQLRTSLILRSFDVRAQRRTWRISEVRELLRVWERRIEKNPRAKKGVITLIIVPPFRDDEFIERYWLAGLANRACGVANRLNGGVAISAAQSFNYLGAPRLEESFVSMVHEMGHLLGASHTTSISMMHANAMAYANYGLEFRPVSYNEIEFCLTTNNLR